MSLGVSVIICCHNSATTLPKTLQHLASQEISADISWEVIVIDNASEDGTAQIALANWPWQKASLLRVIHEPQLGLIHARYRGLAEATYEVLSFIDDDNWVCSNWVQTVSEIMSQHPEVGACGGQNIPEFAKEKPAWFDLSSRSYAVGAQGPDAGGDITWSRGRLVGAGLTIRKSAWQQLVNHGFRSLLVGCQGKRLNRGEDTELCFALVLGGWHLWYEPRLVLRHFLTAARLDWRYLRKLRWGGGRATIGFDPYRFALESCDRPHHISFWWDTSPLVSNQAHPSIWRQQCFSALKDLIFHPLSLIQSLLLLAEGNVNVLMADMGLGRVVELCRARKTYTLNIQAIQEAPWRKQF